MADNVDKINMNSTLVSENTFNVIKEEQCQEDDNFIEDKVCISETAIIINNAVLQDPIWYGKIIKYEKSTCFDTIKTELPSFQASEVQNDNVKIEAGGADIKIEFNNETPYCAHCEIYYEDYCIECGMLVSILNKNALNSADCGAREDIPNNILEIRDCFGQTGIYALRIIPADVNFGPFTGLSATECPWETKGEKFILDNNKWKYFNWMQYVNPTRNISKRNLHVVQCDDNVYYQSTRLIQAGEELLVYFGDKYGDNSNEIVRMDFVTTHIVKDVFACTFCYLGFSSKLHLVKHKTNCFRGTAGEFSIEELTQCSFCKIHLDQKEYYEHHMTFCCERNARKLIPPVKQIEGVNGCKRFRRQTYSCQQCQYRTKYKSDLINHSNNQHRQVKTCKCRICCGLFKTKESLMLHMKNTHIHFGVNEDWEHCTSGYMNTPVKVEQSNSQEQMISRTFKSEVSGYRIKNKRFLKHRTKTIHSEKIHFKCVSCEYRTNYRHSLNRHMRTRHVKGFNFKCDSCEYKTNYKTTLTNHIKTTHLKEFDLKCELCEYRTNSTRNLKRHIKTKHLKEFDFKCDSCEFRTNNKYNLENHIKTTHLKEFDCKCDLCEYKTNSIRNLKRHVKAKHLKEFDFKCDSCEFRTNNKYNFEIHRKRKHLKGFDYKCDSCEYRTNGKYNLEYHVKDKHLKKSEK